MITGGGALESPDLEEHFQYQTQCEKIQKNFRERHFFKKQKMEKQKISIFF